MQVPLIRLSCLLRLMIAFAVSANATTSCAGAKSLLRHEKRRRWNPPIRTRQRGGLHAPPSSLLRAGLWGVLGAGLGETQSARPPGCSVLENPHHDPANAGIEWPHPLGSRAHPLGVAMRAAPSLALSVLLLLSAARASAVSCTPGHNTVVPPCTFEHGLVSLDSATSPDPSTGGHHTLVSFPFLQDFGTGIQVAADVFGGYPPYSATDGGSTSVNFSITFTLSAPNAAEQIKKLRFVAINPQVTGAGSITWTFGNGTPPGSVSGDQNITSGDLIFGSAVGSTTETLTGTLSTGGNGTATADGYAIYVPEPTVLPSLGAMILMLAVLPRRRRPEEPPAKKSIESENAAAPK